KNRPTTADTLTNIIRNAAYSGEAPSTSTSRVGAHTPIANPPVWVRPVNIPAAHSLGYLNSSTQRVSSTDGRAAGRSISLGSTIKAQAADLRAPSSRPMRISQRGDSGTQ